MAIKITNGSKRIFHDAYHYRTSYYKEVRPASIHMGTDYGTSAKALPQYPPLNGAIVRQVVNTETNGDARGCRVRLEWPELNLGMILQHLVKGSVGVKVGQTLTKNNRVGLTGMTGKYRNGTVVSSGVHAHVEVYYINLSPKAPNNLATFNFEDLDFDAIEKIQNPVVQTPEEKQEEEEMRYYKTMSEVPEWAQPAIKKGVENGWIATNADGEFNVPEVNLQNATWFYGTGLWNTPKPTSEAASSWAAESVQKAISKGVLVGDGNSLNLHTPVSTEKLVTYLNRASLLG